MLSYGGLRDGLTTPPGVWEAYGQMGLSKERPTGPKDPQSPIGGPVGLVYLLHDAVSCWYAYIP